MAKKEIVFNHERKNRINRVIQKCLCIVAGIIVAGLFYTGHLSVEKILALFGGK